MSSNEFLHEINLEQEIKSCSISKPYEALKSDFAKKIFKHLSNGTRFKQSYFEGILECLDDEESELSPRQRDDFINILDEYQETFDSIVKRYK